MFINQQRRLAQVKDILLSKLLALAEMLAN
jgi:SAM-dependent methyltransferase